MVYKVPDAYIQNHKEKKMKLVKLVLWLLHTNCYILYGENTKNAVVIDPAGQFEKIKDKLDSLKLNVKYIFLTHAHIDHMIALDELKNYTNARTVIGKLDEEALNDGDKNLADYFKKPCPVSKADITVSDGDTLTLDNHTFKFIHTPGHTIGGMCILIDNMLFSGDTLFYMSVGKVDHYGGDFDAELHSVHTKLMTLDDNITVYPGHGDATTIGFERKNNPFLEW